MLQKFEKISFVVTVALFIGIIISLWYFRFFDFSPLGIVNIVINLCALIIGCAIEIIIILDDTRKMHAKTLTFSILVAVMMLACALNTCENIIDECINDIPIMLVFDSLRAFVEAFIYMLTWTYIAVVLEIDRKLRRKISITMSIFVTVCTSVYIVRLFFMSIIHDTTLFTDMDSSALILNFMGLCFDVLFFYFVIKYSRKKFETASLFSICLASVVAGIFFLFSNLDVSYLVLVVSLIICYSSLYLKNIHEEKQGRLIGYGVQKSLLPKNCIFFKDKIDMAAKTMFAREIGGNFYDYKKTDDLHFSFCISDSLGVGIPAALRMTEAISLLRGYQSASTNVNGIAQALSYSLRKYNQWGVEHNFWLGTLNFDINTLSFVDAGNTLFFVIRDGKYLDVDYKKSPYIGNLNFRKFRLNELDILPGDRIVLFTKSITDVTDKQGRKISLDAIKDLVNTPDVDSAKSIKQVFKYIKDFAQNKNIERDITMLVLKIYEENDEAAVTIQDSATAVADSKLSVDSVVHGKRLTYKLAGVLDSATASILQEAIDKTKDFETFEKIALDLNGVKQVTPAGFRPIIKICDGELRHSKIEIVKGNKAVHAFLDQNGLMEVFDTEGTKWASK